MARLSSSPGSQLPGSYGLPLEVAVFTLICTIAVGCVILMGRHYTTNYRQSVWSREASVFNFHEKLFASSLFLLPIATFIKRIVAGNCKSDWNTLAAPATIPVICTTY